MSVCNIVNMPYTPHYKQVSPSQIPPLQVSSASWAVIIPDCPYPSQNILNDEKKKKKKTPEKTLSFHFPSPTLLPPPTINPTLNIQTNCYFIF